eukprot:gb/GECH01013978.1/.p1 GENE.gb/GECH01013978.1/~~gb/GECH01013978.1/.p1  ORF type:complete len:810 (+),score=182.39 gb/GECH01013978.1/:1-2430(+)
MPPPEKQLSSDEEQEHWLKEAEQQVQKHAFFMQRALDKQSLPEALKHAANMLNELRTSQLTPKNYYRLYMKEFDSLSILEHYFEEEHHRGRRMEELYELVQHAGNIVPRLYLLVTVGAVYVRSKEAPAKDILADLVEMCKGVQHPTRGLFLRHYLSDLSKDKLPDHGTEYEGEGGTVRDAIAFILQNFHEMVRLWVRLQPSANVKDRERREKERLELQLLVGKNLVRLSQLDGVDLELYRTEVLDKVMDVVVGSHDAISQQYLMEAVIQAFPDDFHIATLPVLLHACGRLQPGVDLRAILTALMDRLASFFDRSDSPGTSASPSADANTDIFRVFSDNISQLMDSSVSLESYLSVQKSLANLALKCYPQELSYMDEVLSSSAQRFRESDNMQQTEPVTQLLRRLLLLPVEQYQNVLVLLHLEHYSDLMQILAYTHRRDIAVAIARAALKYRHPITSSEQVNKLFELMRPLMKDESDAPEAEEEDPETWEQDQHLIGRMVHLMDNEDSDQLFEVYRFARKHFGQGGVRRFRYTLVPLVFAYLRLAVRIHEGNEDGDDDDGGDDENETSPTVKEDHVFKYTLAILEVLAGQYPELALRLYLDASLAADRCGLARIVYELMSQAFLLYEEEISDSKIQLQYLMQIVATLEQLHHLDEDYDTLSAKACQYSAHLLRKPDQCRAAFTCAHLFWHQQDEDENSARKRDSVRVLECLQRSVKIVESCMAAQQLPLFVEILNKYLYHFDEHNEKINSKYINGIIDLINKNIKGEEEEDSVEPVDSAVASVPEFYSNTLSHIDHKKAEEPDHYANVNV